MKKKTSSVKSPIEKNEDMIVAMGGRRWLVSTSAYMTTWIRPANICEQQVGLKGKVAQLQHAYVLQYVVENLGGWIRKEEAVVDELLSIRSRA